MEWKVYILFSEKFKRTYVGCSSDTLARLSTHNSRKVSSTKSFVPWRIVYEEVVGTYEDARKQEKYFKTAAGRRKIKSIFDQLGLN